MNVIKIPAKPQKGNSAAKTEIKKLRVAAYCRVSTDNEEQKPLHRCSAYPRENRAESQITALNGD